MDPKKLEKYFALSELPYLFGVGLLVVSFFFIWLGRAYNWYMYIVGVLSFAIGIVLFLVGSVGRVSADYIDAEADRRLVDFGNSMLEDVQLAKRVAEHYEPVYLKQFEYDGEGLESRRGRDNKWRTSRFSALRLFFLNDGIALTHRTFSLIGEEDSLIPPTEYKYSELGKAEIIRDSVKLKSGKQTLTVKRARMLLRDSEGKQILLTAVPDDMDSDKLAEQINRLAAKGSAL